MSIPARQAPVNGFDYLHVLNLNKTQIAEGLGFGTGKKGQDRLNPLKSFIHKTWKERFPNGLDLRRNQSMDEESAFNTLLTEILDSNEWSALVGGLVDKTDDNAAVHRRWAKAALRVLIYPCNRKLKMKSAADSTPTSSREEEPQPGGTLGSPSPSLHREPSTSTTLPFTALKDVSLRVTVEGSRLCFHTPIIHLLQPGTVEPWSASTEINEDRFCEKMTNVLQSIVENAPRFLIKANCDYVLMLRTCQPSTGEPETPIVDPSSLFCVLHQAVNCLYQDGLSWSTIPAVLMTRRSMYARDQIPSSKRPASVEQHGSTNNNITKMPKRTADSSPHAPGNLSQELSEEVLGSHSQPLPGGGTQSRTSFVSATENDDEELLNQHLPGEASKRFTHTYKIEESDDETSNPINLLSPSLSRRGSSQSLGRDLSPLSQEGDHHTSDGT